MAVKLAKLEAKIGEQKRLLVSLQAERQTALENLDAKEAVVEDLSTKIQAAIDAKEDPSEDDTKALTAAKDEYKAIRTTVVKLGDKISAERSALSDLEADFSTRQEHNKFEAELSESSGRQTESVTEPGAEGAGGASGERIRVLEASDEQLDHDLGVMFQVSMIAGLDHRSIQEVAAGMGNERVIQAANTANSHSAGGSWIQGRYLDRFVEQLRPYSIIRNAGVDEVPLDDGSLEMPEEVAGPAGAYLGETQVADTEQVTTGSIKLIAKELVVQVVASEKLIRSPSAKAAARIRRSVLKGAGQTEDQYFLRGSASSAGPTGLRYLAPASNVFTANTTVNLTNTEADLDKLDLALLNGNVIWDIPFYSMSPRTAVYLTSLRDGNGNKVYPEMSLPRPMLRGKPVYTSTQIPVNIGGAGSGSEIILAEGSHLIIGDAPKLQYESSNVAAYNQGGVVKAAFSERNVVSRMVMENDFNTLQKKAIAVLDDVRWGA